MSAWGASATLVGALTLGLTTVPWLLATGDWRTLALAGEQMVGDMPSLFPVALALVGLTIVRALPVLELETPADEEPVRMTRFPPEDVLWPSAPERKRNHEFRPISDVAPRRRSDADVVSESIEVLASEVPKREGALADGEGMAASDGQIGK